MITSWSPSKLFQYEECPAKAKYKYVEKLPEPGSPALDYGSEVHAHAEQYITGRVKDLHPSLTKVEKDLKKFRKGYQSSQVRVELELAVDKDWKPVGWLDKAVWARFKLDLRHLLKRMLNVVDWKTGGIDKKTGQVKRDTASEIKYRDQLDAYQVASLSCEPNADVVQAALVFVDAGETIRINPLKRKDLEIAQKKWASRVKPMLSDTLFAPRPGNYCRWCVFSRNKGGKCLY